MSMHMIQGVQVHGKSKKKKSPGWQKAEAEHNAWLRKQGIDPDAKPKKHKVVPYEKTLAPNSHSESDRQRISTSDTIPGNGSAKERNEYTGDYIVGIATMHKSTLVPVGRGDDPKEYARMRRG